MNIYWQKDAHNCSTSHFEDQNTHCPRCFRNAFWPLMAHSCDPLRNCPQLKGTGCLRSHTPLGAASILWLISLGTQRSSSLFQFWATLLGNPNSSSWDCLKPFTRLHYTLTSPYCLCWFLHFLTGTVLNSPINFLQTNLHLKICFPGKQPKTVGARGDWRGNQWCAGTC